MPSIKIIGERLEDGDKQIFYYNNLTGLISNSDDLVDPVVEDVDIKGIGSKNGPFKVIKVQLGLSCNYECGYCSQRFVERPPETSKKDIDSFMVMFDALPKEAQFKIEFWGGEPFVYWKTLKPLAEAIRAKYPNARFSTITNGSMLTLEIVDWLCDMGFGVAISHDGPGQHVRGDDPLDDNYDVLAYAVEKFQSSGRGFSFNSMLHKDNPSRLAIIEFFEKKFPGKFIAHGEMGFIDSYDADGLSAITMPMSQHFDIRRNLWAEMRLVSKVGEHCSTQAQQAAMIPMLNGGGGAQDGCSMNVNGTAAATEFQAFGQKCGMEKNDTVAIDLRGNVITCQNTSSVETAPNGESHLIGHVTDLASVALKTATHWTKRDHCRSCPVLLHCKGSCMFLEGDLWHASCDMSYTNAITLLAVGFELATGYVPVAIDEPGLPEHRQDVFGTSKDWAALDKPVRKTIPIKAV